MEALAANEKVVGLKQVRRAVASGKVRKVYLACDADPRLTEPVEALCQAAGIAVVTDYTMAQLGRLRAVPVGPGLLHRRGHRSCCGAGGVTPPTILFLAE